MKFHISKAETTGGNGRIINISLSKQYNKSSVLQMTHYGFAFDTSYDGDFDLGVMLQSYPCCDNSIIRSFWENRNINAKVWNFISTIRTFHLLRNNTERQNLSKWIYVNKGSCDNHGHPMYLDCGEITRHDILNTNISSYRLFQLHGSEVIYKP